MLCLAVMLSVMVVGAGAAFSDQDKIENTEAVDACSALNIINGYEDGAFHPERNIKRAEVTKMICVALNGGEEPNTSTNAKPTFTDVRGTIYAWAEGYIESCYAQGIVDGVNGNRFAPASNVTAAQLAKMLLVSLGYNAKAENFTGNTWETNVNVRASQKHLYDGLEKMDTSAPVTRDQAAQMVWNAMQAYVVEYKDGVVQDKVVGDTKDKITLLYDKYEAYVNVGTLTSISGKDLTITMSKADEADSDLKDVKEFTKLNKDYSALIGQKVKVIFTKSSEVLNVFATDDNTTYTVNMKDIEEDGDKVKFDGKSYGFDDGSKISVVTLNVKDEKVVTGEKKDAGYFDTVKNKTATAVVKFVDNDGDGKLNIAIVTEYLAKEVTYVGSDRITAGATYKMADENIAKDIAKDDYAQISYNMYDDCLDIVKAEVVSDTLNSSKDKKDYVQYEVGKTWYNISEDEANNVSVGDTVKAHVVAGVIVSIETDDGTAALPTNIAVVVGAGKDSSLTGDQVKLRFFDGTTKIVTLDSKGDVTSADDAKLGQAYKLSGSDNNTRLDDLKSGNKYNGFYWNTKTNGKPLDTTVATPDSDMIAGMKVADNAVIVLYDGKGASKTITGKQFNALKNDDIAGVAAAETNTTFTKSVNGLDRVMLASVKVKDINVSGVSYDNYGYVVTAGAKKANGDIEFTMWNGSENLTVLWENGDETKLVKGTLVAYASINDKKYVQDGEVIGTLEQIKDGKAIVNDQGFKAGANKAEDSKTISVDTTSLDVTADTKVLVLDTDATKDEDIGLKYTYGDKLATAAEKAKDSYCYNVVYRVEDGKGASDGADLDLLVIDNTGAFDFDKPGKDDNNQGHVDNNIEGLATSLNKDGNELTVAFNVPAGTTGLKVDYTAKVDGIFAKGGTASTGGDPAISVNGTQAKFTITLDNSAESKDAITLDLSNLVYTGAGAGATADTVNDMLKQEKADITVTKEVPAGEIVVPKDAKLTLGDGTTATEVTGKTTIKSEDGSVEVKGNVVVKKDATLTITGDVKDASKIQVEEGGTLIVDGVTYTGANGIFELESTSAPAGRATVATLTLVFNANDAVEATVANGKLAVNGKNAPVVITVKTSGTCEVTVDGEKVTVPTAGLIIGLKQDALLRGEGPGKKGSSVTKFEYGEAYKAAGVALADGKLTVDMGKLAKFAETDGDNGDQSYGGSGAHSARHHLTQKSGELSGADALFAGLTFGAPQEVSGATKVMVTMNDTVLAGDDGNKFTLSSNSVSGTGNDTLNNSFVKYLPFAKGGADNTPAKIDNKSYSFEFTWLDNSGNALAKTYCTINRVAQ